MGLWQWLRSIYSIYTLEEHCRDNAANDYKYFTTESSSNTELTYSDFQDIKRPQRQTSKEDNEVAGSFIQDWEMPGMMSRTTRICQKHLIYLYEQLQFIIAQGRSLLIIPECNDKYLAEITDPAAQPFVWVSKWVDYTDKYGFGYQLSDHRVGVMFNDQTRIIVLSNFRNVHYIEQDGTEYCYIIGSTPPELDKKMKIFIHFQRYMNNHLTRSGPDVTLPYSLEYSAGPYLHMWLRTRSGVVMQLSDGIIQINFQDHSKIILCPLMDTVTYIDLKKNFRTFSFSTLLTDGCPEGLVNCLHYAYSMLPELLKLKGPETMRPKRKLDKSKKTFNLKNKNDIMEIQGILVDQSDDDDDPTATEADKIDNHDGDEGEERIEEREGDSESELSNDEEDMSEREPMEEDHEYYTAFRKELV